MPQTRNTGTAANRQSGRAGNGPASRQEQITGSATPLTYSMRDHVLGSIDHACGLAQQLGIPKNEIVSRVNRQAR